MKKLFILAIFLSAWPQLRAESNEDIFQALIDNAPEACTPDDAPAIKYAAFNGKLVMGLCGQLKATATYDLGNVMDDPNNFVSLDIPINPAPGSGGKFMFSAQQSSLTLNVVALPNTKDQVGLYVCTNLLGDNYTPALEYVLVNYRGFSAGLGYTLFSDTRAAVPTIDYMGPDGYTGVGNAGIQYQKLFPCGLKVGIGAELPLIHYTGYDEVAEVTQRVPDIPIAISYNWNDNSDWARLSAVVRNMQYRDLLTARNRDNVGWGVQLSGSVGILPSLRVMYQATYGDGIASYFQDYTEHATDMMPDPSRPGALKNVRAWGGYIGLQYNFTDNVYMSAAYSQVRTYATEYEGGETPWGDQCRYTQYAVGNLFWDINRYLTWGVEYIYGRRKNYDSQQGHDSRIQTMLQFSF